MIKRFVLLALLGHAAHLHAGVLDDLRGGAVLACQPALKVYCRNVHVSCAGRTAISTRLLTVSVGLNDSQFRVQVASAMDGTAPEALRASGVFEADGQALTLRTGDDAGYIRILATGSYAERTYQFGPALMAYGQCSVITTQ